MGSFSYSCQVSGLPITSGDKAYIILLKHRGRLYDLSDENLKVYGKASFISNEGPCAKFTPIAFPILGTYDDYGGLENIVKDTNTEVLEKYFGLTIEEIVNVVTSGRKDDGYDDALTKLKDPEAPERDSNGCLNATYLPQYNELLSLSATWIQGDFYEELTKDKLTGRFDDSIDLGTPSILKALGFKELEEKGTDERYNRLFKNGPVTLESDGTWLKGSIYYLPVLQKFCKSKGLDIEIDEIYQKNKTQQIYDYVLPDVRDKLFKEIQEDEEEGNFDDDFISVEDSEFLDTIIKSIGKGEKPEEDEESVAKLKRLRKIMRKNMFGVLNSSDHDVAGVKHIFLEGYYYNTNSPLTKKFILATENGDLRDQANRFYIMSSYMYSLGRYWDIIGTSCQDGDYRGVLKVLETAVSVIKNNFSDYIEDEEDEDEDYE